MNPKRIILHHSLTKDSQTVSTGIIRRYHTEQLGWNDIGYHFLIELLRYDFEIVMGRMVDTKGAHCEGHNDDSIGICFIGDFDMIEPPKELWNAGIKLVTYLMKQFNIKDIKGHREYNSNKTCPGLLFDLDKFRNDCFSNLAKEFNNGI